MPVPYRRTPRAAEYGLAAYLDAVWLPADRTLYGGILVLEGKGQPQEFVHNTLAAPSGILWPDEKALEIGIPMLAHSLFDACRPEPDVLVCLSVLGPPEFLRVELAPSIPFAQVSPPRESIPAEWGWVNDAPTPGMRAYVLAEELARRGFIVEPFERLRSALRLVYPQATWDPCAAE